MVPLQSAQNEDISYPFSSLSLLCRARALELTMRVVKQALVGVVVSPIISYVAQLYDEAITPIVDALLSPRRSQASLDSDALVRNHVACRG